MSSNYDSRQAQETLHRIADEFLALYLQSAMINGYCFTSRLFVMGHALELYTKSNLIGKHDIKKLSSHKLYRYVSEVDPRFALPSEVVEAGKKLFSRDVRNFDMGLQLKYKEELELYQIYYHLADLKYYISRDGQVIFPVVSSTIQFNKKYLTMIGTLRRRIIIGNRTQKDEELKGLIKYFGIDYQEVKDLF